MEPNEFIIMFVILGFVVFTILGTAIHEKNVGLIKFNPNDLSINTSMMENLKYEIRIDCKWVAESELNDMIVNETKISTFCKAFFPELFNKSKEEKNK